MKSTSLAVKIQPNTTLYAKENSDYTIRILSRSDKTAIVQGLLKTREQIHTDESGNEYIQFRSDWGRTQTYYANATC